MTELKTLKDLKDKYLWFGTMEYDLIRLEAIKWIKELSDYNTKAFQDYENDGNTSSAVNWIKQFFNIKEEELQ